MNFSGGPSNTEHIFPGNDGSVSLAQLNVWNATEPLIILYTRVILTLERVQQLEEKIFLGKRHGHHKAS